MDEIVEENIAKQTAYLVGKNNGVEEGSEQTQRDNIVNFYKNNVSIDIISKSTGLTIDEVEKIIKEAND